MRYLVTSEEMKKYDANTAEKIGIPSLVLMERAALSVVQSLRERGFVRKNEPAFILTGCGNNGGDGLAIARLLCEAGMQVEVQVLGNMDKATAAWKTQKGILEYFPVIFCKEPSRPSYTVIIDALFGVGLSRPVEGAYAEGIRTVNGLHGYKVAVDVPSGISADTGEELGIAFTADLTVTFGFEKRGLYLLRGRSLAGEILLTDVGITWRSFGGEAPEMFCLDERALDLLPRRDAGGNKGTFGKALLLAGSFQMAGAAVLCARACYAMGAGMVKVLTCEENRGILQEAVPEALLGTTADLETSLAWCDVIALGPGWGQGEENRAVFHKILTETDKPLVCDADALNLLAKEPELAKELQRQGRSGRQIVLTPHLGELLRLLNGIRKEGDLREALSMEALCKDPWEEAKNLAEYLSVVVAAKDARTSICAPDRKICLNLTGNSGMATAGSGDVLTGVITALLCQKMDAYTAACRGVYLHGLAGDLAKKRYGEHGLVAGDLITMMREEFAHEREI